MVRITRDLEIILPRGTNKVTPAEAFDVARELVRRGARAIIEQEIDRGAPRSPARASSRRAAR
jgi:hypothetical protein